MSLEIPFPIADGEFFRYFFMKTLSLTFIIYMGPQYTPVLFSLNNVIHLCSVNKYRFIFLFFNHFLVIYCVITRIYLTL